MGELLNDPIPTSIQPGDISVELLEFTQLEPGPAGFARNFINFTYHAADGSGRMYTGESKGGQIHIVGSSGVVEAEPFLNLREALGVDFIDNAREAGLRTFAFHPDFHIEGADGEGKFYTMATMSVDSAQVGVPVFAAPIEAFFHSVLTEWTVDPNNPDRIDPTSAREIFRIEELAQNLNAEQVMFDPNAVPGDGLRHALCLHRHGLLQPRA